MALLGLLLFISPRPARPGPAIFMVLMRAATPRVYIYIYVSISDRRRKARGKRKTSGAVKIKSVGFVFGDESPRAEWEI